MTKKILLTCAILASVHCGGDETPCPEENTTKYMFYFPEIGEIDLVIKTPNGVKIDEDLIKTGIQKGITLENSDLNGEKCILIQEIKTLEDCKAAWMELYAQIHGQSAEFKKAFYEKHQSKLEELEDYMNAQLDIRNNQTDFDIEEVVIARQGFYSEVGKLIILEEKIRLASTLNKNDSRSVIKGALAEIRNEIAAVVLRGVEPYHLFTTQQKVIKKILPIYKKPGCSDEEFEFQDESLKDCNGEVRTLVDWLNQKRKIYRTPLENLIKEYSGYPQKLQAALPMYVASTHPVRQQGFRALCEHIYHKAFTDRVDEIINYGFSLNDIFLYPQLLQAIIVFSKIVGFVIRIDELESIIGLMESSRLPAHCIKDVMGYVSNWILLMTGEPSFAVNSNQIHVERETALGLAKRNEIPELYNYIEPWVKYVNIKALDFIAKGRTTNTPNFFDLPIDMIP